MEILIGMQPDAYDDDAMALGSLLARSLGATPVLAHIYPLDFDFPGAGNVDAEWVEYLVGQAGELLAESRERFTRRHEWSEVPVAMAGHRSSGSGLAALARERGAEMIVIGSTAGAARGRFAIGSTANQLLHEAPVPVATAPTGYAREDVADFGRVILAFSDSRESGANVPAAAELARTLNVPLELLTVLLRHRMYGSRVGATGEGAVIEELRDQTLLRAQQAMADLTDELPHTARTITADSVASALNRLPWHGDELLVMGSATHGPVLRVFLGDMTYKLLRSSPVPAVVLPRSR